MALREIKPNPNGGPLVVSVTIGHANSGLYGVYLFETDKVTFRTIGSGDALNGNGADLVVGDAATLAGKFLAWDVVAVPLAGTHFSATLKARQGSTQLTQFTDQGDLTGANNFATIRASAILK